MLTVFMVSLALTLFFELFFALLWGLHDSYELKLVTLVNCLTNPVVVLLHHTFPHPAVTLGLECSAVVVEWLCYRGCSRALKQPLLFSALANGFSYGLGCIVNLL